MTIAQKFLSKDLNDSQIAAFFQLIIWNRVMYICVLTVIVVRQVGLKTVFKKIGLISFVNYDTSFKDMTNRIFKIIKSGVSKILIKSIVKKNSEIFNFS